MVHLFNKLSIYSAQIENHTAAGLYINAQSAQLNLHAYEMVRDSPSGHTSWYTA